MQRLARTLIGDASAAEDLVAEAIARTLPKWREGSVDDCGVYLRRVVVNLAARRWRRRALGRRRDHAALDWLEFTHDRVTVTRNGRPSAVLISPEELTSLEDTLDLLSDPEAIAQLLQSQSAHVAGDYVTGEELAAKYLNR